MASFFFMNGCTVICRRNIFWFYSLGFWFRVVVQLHCQLQSMDSLTFSFSADTGILSLDCPDHWTNIVEEHDSVVPGQHDRAEDDC